MQSFIRWRSLRGFRAWHPHGVLLVLAVLALFPRLVALDLAPFKGDEAKLYNHAYELAREGIWPRVFTKSSTGLFNPPLPVYLLAPVLRAAPDTLLATGFVALLNGAAVVLLAWWVGREFGWTAGTLAGTLYAVSFWAIIFARRLWDVSLAPPLALLFLIALSEWVLRQRPWAMVWTTVALAILLQTHFSAFGYALLVPAALLLGAPIRWRLVPLAAALFALLWLPYLSWEVQSGFHNLSALRRLEAAPSQWDLQIARLAPALLSTAGFGAFWAPARGPYLEESVIRVALREGLAALFWLSLGTVALAAVRSGGEQRRAQAMRLLLAWALVPLLPFLYRSYDLLLHYLIPVTPALFAALGVGLVTILRAAPRGRPLLLGALGLFLLAQVGIESWTLTRFLLWVDRENSTQTYGVPLKYSRQAAERLLALFQDGDRAYLLAHNLAQDDSVEVFAALTRKRLFLKPLDGQTALVLPPQGKGAVFYLVPAPLAPQAATDRGTETAAAAFADSLVAEVRYPGEGGRAYRLYRLPSDAARERIDAWGGDAVSFENGVRLTLRAVPADGWRTAPGKELVVTLPWEIEKIGALPRPDYRFFVHLVDEQERIVSQWDGLGYPTWAWEPGEAALSRVPLVVPKATPSGSYRLNVGMYDAATLQRVELRTPKGEKSHFIELGKVAIYTD